MISRFNENVGTLLSGDGEPMVGGADEAGDLLHAHVFRSDLGGKCQLSVGITRRVWVPL